MRQVWWVFLSLFCPTAGEKVGALPQALELPRELAHTNTLGCYARDWGPGLDKVRCHTLLPSPRDCIVVDSLGGIGSLRRPVGPTIRIATFLKMERLDCASVLSKTVHWQHMHLKVPRLLSKSLQPSPCVHSWLTCGWPVGHILQLPTGRLVPCCLRCTADVGTRAHPLPCSWRQHPCQRELLYI